MSDEDVNDLMVQLFLQAKAQFGSAVKAFWFNDSDACPGCGGEIDAVQIKGEEAISLNAFIYRPRGVLIGYVLCNRCARRIFRDTKRNPYQQTDLHATIETNLEKAYKRHLRSMSA